MTPDERQELRAKHHVGQNEADDQCQGCFTISYPCDVIRVLDAWEATPPEATSSECDVDHDTVMGCERLGNGWTDVDTNFCPKCGVKL